MYTINKSWVNSKEIIHLWCKEEEAALKNKCKTYGGVYFLFFMTPVGWTEVGA